MLAGVRVVDRTSGIAGPYCSKLLADAGADVVKVEPSGGDPMRGRGSGGLFEFLNTTKRSVQGEVAGLIAAADVLLVDGLPDPDLRAGAPGLVIVSITPFGCTGPWSERPATEFTLQAACGSIGNRGLPENPPLAAGGQLGEWITGTYAAIAAVAALRSARASGVGEHVDVSMFDCMAVTMTTYPSVFAEFLGWPAIKGTGRSIEVPSVEPTSDGYAVITTNSAQQFQDFLVMIDRADWLDDESLATAVQRFARRDEFLDAVHDFTTKRTTDQLLAELGDFRIPAGPVLNGATVTSFEQFVERGVFVTSPSGRFRQPRTPYRISGVAPRPFSPPPEAGEHTGDIDWSRRPITFTEPWQLPLAGVRVVDCTAWWAGPAGPHVLACLGADVIKVESTTRPDLMRYSSTKPATEEQWWEWGPIFHAVNVGKRAVTLDLTTPDGVSVFERLLATADVLVENYTPRVMEQFGLGWERVHKVNPALVMVRMPAFGLDGPWRDRTGFAQTMECVTGMAWMTGFPNGPPVLVRGACDPLAGMHAVFATFVALAQRDRTGEGSVVEAVMVEAALNAAAEQVIEHDMHGGVLTRQGNRGPDAAPQGVYRCTGDERWLALAIETDAQWRALVGVLGQPAWATKPELAQVISRRAAHDRIDAALSAWTVAQDADSLAETLAAVGVPAAAVIPAREVAHNPQLRYRGLFETEDHPVTGRHEIPSMPFRFTHVDRWARRPAPLLGQHNDEVLAQVLDDPSELDRLRADGVVGERLAGR